MSNRNELRDELEVLLGAARTLSPDTDRFLAERFVDKLERHRYRPPLVRIPRLGVRQRVTAFLLALVAVGAGGWLLLFAQTGHPSVQPQGPGFALATPNFHLNSVRLQSCTCFPAAPLRRVKVGQKVDLSLYYWIRRGEGMQHATLTISRDGHWVGFVAPPPVPAPAYSSETQFGLPYRFRAPGEYRIKGWMTINGVTSPTVQTWVTVVK